jgi:hypothetical protein
MLSFIKDKYQIHSLQYSQIFFIFIIASLVRFSYIFFFVDGADLIAEDQSAYINFAKFLVENGPSAYLEQNNEMFAERTPVYPFFLMWVYSFIADSNIAVVYIQAFIDSFTCIIIGLLCKNFVKSGLLSGGLISALNMNMVIISGTILTDTLFLFFFSLFCLFSIRYIKNLNNYNILLSILTLSISTLIRPVSYYLVFVVLFLLIVFYISNRTPIKKSFSGVSIYIVILLVTLGGVHYKNYIAYNSLSYVSEGGVHALNWVYPASYQYSSQGTYEEGKKNANLYLNEAMKRDNISQLPDNPFSYSQYLMLVAKDALLELGIPNLVQAWTVGTVINLMSPSLAFSPIVRSMEHPSFYMTGGSGIFEKMYNYISKTGSLSYISILFFGTVSSFIFVLATIVGFFKKIVSEDKTTEDYAILCLLFIVVMYFIVITGPIIGVKYRLPIEPIMTIFVAYAINVIKLKW